ncbi:MAG TPA: hypothetical protein VEA99_08850, partial [Gemmatimonadaceae bacterium]|nr:hypothetical protein [Gemmatimonadaceae bacterium]
MNPLLVVAGKLLAGLAAAGAAVALVVHTAAAGRGTIPRWYAAPGIDVLFELPTTEPLVALTIDDGPSEST